MSDNPFNDVARLCDEVRPGYSDEIIDTIVIEKVSADLTRRFSRGFSRPDLQRFREFYLRFPREDIRSTLSSESRSASPAKIRSTASSESQVRILARAFPLPWLQYVVLIGRARSLEALTFYHGASATRRA